MISSWGTSESLGSSGGTLRGSAGRGCWEAAEESLACQSLDEGAQRHGGHTWP